MTRVCFTMRLRPGVREEYIARHSPVPADMLEELAASGRRDYSINLTDDDLVIGHYETDDDEAAQAYLDRSETATRWERESARFFADLDGRADQAAERAREVFHLSDQLAAAPSVRHESEER